ncbi:MAG: electron transport complex subunit RsxB [Gammaproteobacteria bacterium]|nr:electron transport complex subunit RsxB [Gammaproteobacteria bacterium]
MIAIITIGLLALALGLALGFAADRFRITKNPVVEQINNLLPQTQCGQCNFPGCRPYAEAIAAGRADINQCPPGGEATIQALANLLGRDIKSLDPDYGEEKPLAIAVIDEDLCIGCTICIQACPVDAILGASKQMHTVIESECTGCDLCVEPCPVDCIDMVVPESRPGNWKWPSPENWVSR